MGRLHWFANGTRAKLMISAVAILLVVGAVTVGSLLRGAPAAQPTSFPPWYPMTNAAGDPVFADFENHLPCAIDQPAVADRQRVKYGIVLYRDAETGEPTTYLTSTVRVGVGNDRETHQGSWRITTGTGLDPQARVYELDTNAPAHLRHYWPIGEDILFILDENRMPRVGDAAYGYALNSIPLGLRNVTPPR